ncbi:MAG TPA: hypothetical protein VH092_32030 [Urbifossiella sp.]|nr:hypothetical protein [Urbifossiella sp.]
MTRIGVAIAALVVAGAAVSQTGRPAPDPGVPLITRLPSHVADPALVEELKLTPDQVKALAPAGPKKGGPGQGGPTKVAAGKGEPGQAVPTAKAGPAGEPAFVAKAKEVLTPEQYKRAVQLMAQDVLREGRDGAVTPAALVAVSTTIFRRYPELAEAAKLTRDQKRRITPLPAAPAGPEFGGPPPVAGTTSGGLPGAVHIVLEPDQTAALAAFVGPLRTTPFAPAVGGPMAGPGGGPRVAPGGPGGFVQPGQRVMVAINNRGELKLTDEQANTLQTLLNESRGIVRAPAGGGGPPMPVTPTPPADTEAALAKALNPTQMTRLKQIELWQQVPPGADDTAKFDIPRVATAIALTADQKAELKAIGGTHREKAAQALETADSAAGLKTALAAARAEVATGVGELLTEEQGTKLRDLFGPEYRGAGAGMMGNDIFRRIRAAGYGNYQFEIMVVNRFAGVAEDLKLSEEQKATMTAAETAFNQQFQQTAFNYDGPEKELAKQASDRSKAMQKIFDDNFNPDQKKRFRELCIQLREQLTANQVGNSAYPPTGAPGVADELKLTAEQRKRIIDTGEEDEILTATQRAELKRLAGPPLSGGFNFGGPARSRPVQPSVRIALLHAGTAHADLRLDPDQAYLIAEIIEAHAAELRPVNPGRNAGQFGYVEPPAAEIVEETVQACEKAFHMVLTPAQRDRLGQLILQSAAHASLTAAFARPEVTGKLGFTPGQRTKLDDITADYRGRVNHVNALPNSAGWPELRQRALKEMREKARDRMLGVLTARQTAAWRELTGAACPAIAAVTPPGGPGVDP